MKRLIKGNTEEVFNAAAPERPRDAMLSVVVEELDKLSGEFSYTVEHEKNNTALISGGSFIAVYDSGNVTFGNKGLKQYADMIPLDAADARRYAGSFANLVRWEKREAPNRAILRANPRGPGSQ